MRSEADRALRGRAARPGRLRLRPLVSVVALLAVGAEVEAQSDARLKLAGDVRLRVERDWASLDADGAPRPDRDRLRGRLRFGFTYALDEAISFGGRVRSGARESQQSPHVTFGDDLRPKQLNLDKLFVAAQGAGWWVWGGKNSFPFWTHNELVWDDDVTPEGVAAGYRRGLGAAGRLALSGAYFVLDETQASRDLGAQARLIAGQAHLRGEASRFGLDAALGVLRFETGGEGSSAALRGLDHAIVVLSVRVETKGRHGPLALAFDRIENLEDLPEPLAHRDETSGWTAAASWGGLAKRGQWLAALTYAHVEEYAVVPSFAQDDWVRWGSATETRSSNFAGWELRLGYAVRERCNVLARYYDVEGLRVRPGGSVLETGKRVRVDVNVGF